MNEKIQIEDKGMRAALSYDKADCHPGLTIGEDGLVSRDSLARLGSLAWCPEMEEDDPDFDEKFIEIEDLSVLRFCPNLSYLVLNHNNIACLEPLRAIGEKMRYVHFHCNLIESLNGLENMPVLDSLELDYCSQLRNIRAIEGLPALRTVNLNFTQVEDFSPLLTLPSLKIVALGGLKFEESHIHKEVFTELVARGVRFIGQYEVQDWVQRWAQESSMTSMGDEEDAIASLLKGLGLVELERIWKKDGVRALSSQKRTILMELAYIFGPSRNDQESFEKIRIKLVRLLVKAGADINDDYNGTALTTVLEKREPDLALAEEFLYLGPNPKLPKRKPAVATALGFWYKNHPEEALAFVERLIEFGADLENEAVKRIVETKGIFLRS